jgi:endonuclease/exonuclease/phosphatase (EEP) superfamily protein YafD
LNKQRLRYAANLFLALPIFLIGAFSLIAFGDQWSFFPYILVWFRWQYLVALLCCATATAFLRNWTLLALCLLFSVPNAVALAPYYLPNGRPDSAEKQHLRICQVNVNYANPNHDKVIAYIKRCNPDVILMQELTQVWADAIEEAFPEYRHITKVPRPDAYGIGTFSRLPLTRDDVKRYGELEYPCAVSWIRWNDTDVKITNVHLLTGTNPRHLYGQTRQFAELTRDTHSAGGAQIVAGDFNAPIWSSGIQKLLAAANLHNSADGFGWQPTWPQDLWASAMLGVPVPDDIIRVPIDHCLVSDQLLVTGFSVGNDIGSDHYPVCIDIEPIRKSSQ